MKRLLISFTLIAFAVAIFAQDYSLPRPLRSKDEKFIKHSSYSCSFNTTRFTPTYVAWTLTPDRVNGKTKRTDYFDVDPLIAKQFQVKHSDYTNSGYDRGHMCPAADNRHSLAAMTECFYMTNMCPQNRSLNAGGWNELETQCRQWAKDYGKIYICAGPVYDQSKRIRKIGKRKNVRVAVPTGFYKVILMMGRIPKAIGFLYPNAPANGDLRDYAKSVDEIERITGLDFFYQLDNTIERTVERECRPAAWGI